MLTKAQLIADGCVENRNMWLGDGWFFCMACGTYAFHEALSHPGTADCYECCENCHTYTGNRPLIKGSTNADCR